MYYYEENLVKRNSTFKLVMKESSGRDNEKSQRMSFINLHKICSHLWNLCEITKAF